MISPEEEWTRTTDRWNTKWDVLSLEASGDKLLSTETVKRHEVENVFRARLHRIGASL